MTRRILKCKFGDYNIDLFMIDNRFWWVNWITGYPETKADKILTLITVK